MSGVCRIMAAWAAAGAVENGGDVDVQIHNKK